MFTAYACSPLCPMVHVQSNGCRSDSPQSSHADLPNLTLPAQGDRRQPLDSPVFQADRHSRSPLIHTLHGCSNPLRSYCSFSSDIHGRNRFLCGQLNEAEGARPNWEYSSEIGPPSP